MDFMNFYCNTDLNLDVNERYFTRLWLDKFDLNFFRSYVKKKIVFVVLDLVQMPNIAVLSAGSVQDHPYGGNLHYLSVAIPHIQKHPTPI